MTALPLLGLLGLLAGCPGPPREPLGYRYRQPMLAAPPAAPLAGEGWRAGVVARAETALGHRLGATRRRATLALIARALGRPVTWSALRALPVRAGSPAPGDLVLFGTASRGRRRLVAAGVVTAARGPAVRFVHVVGGRARAGVLTPSRPAARRARGALLNSYVRPVRRGDPPALPRLAAPLLLGYASLPP